MNIGDLLFQLFTFILLIGLVYAVYFAVRSLAMKKPNNTAHLEQKLDRIIELLEKERKE